MFGLNLTLLQNDYYLCVKVITRTTQEEDVHEKRVT